MAKEVQNLELWLRKIKESKSQLEVLSLIDEFRLLNWADDERAKMGRTYIATLEKLSQAEASKPQGKKNSQSNDGPVWYEKM